MIIPFSPTIIIRASANVYYCPRRKKLITLEETRP